MTQSTLQIIPKTQQEMLMNMCTSTG